MRTALEMSNLRRKFLSLKSSSIGELSKIKFLIQGNFLSSLLKYFDNRYEFKDNLSIAAIVKNEAPYIQEWIEFHRLIGITKFYIFDNDSEDELKEKLKFYISEGIVELHRISGTGKQLEAYKKAINISKNQTRWLAILDVDEFLLPLENKKILDILNEKKRSALLVGWMIYGSNGFKKKPNGLVLENYKKHAKDNFIADYKSIVNPRKVINVKNPHFIQVVGKTTDENGKRIWNYPYINLPQTLPAPKKKIRINHYFCKSLEEFEIKAQRGYADSNSDDQRLKRNLVDFKEHDQNLEEDNFLDDYIPELKKRLERRK